MILARGAIAALTFSAAACTHAGGTTPPVTAPVAQTPQQQPAQPKPPATTAESSSDLQAVTAYNARIREYAALHNRLEATLPAMTVKTSPEAIDRHQRGLEQLIVASRKSAVRGDIFTADIERVVRRVLGQVFAGPDGRQLKETIRDEHTVDVKLAVNARYPDQLPLSTMPPQVLALLPRLPDELEYRFIGHRLILLDVHAHTIADYLDAVLPK
ncbi:MAG TPA: hypothetical protein VNJ03_09055 [Vicinamibacterales bacterium]|nr:hypothetical protein [Vicinamibacterales bacterium]